jgi:ribonucleoside-diphosphate reductase alpha chain
MVFVTRSWPSSVPAPGLEKLSSRRAGPHLSFKRATRPAARLALRRPVASSAVERAAEARVRAYEGESCRECGNFTLVRNGTCLKCDTCGGTSGCS